MEKINGSILHDERSCEKLIINTFLSNYFNEQFGCEFQYHSETDRFLKVDAKQQVSKPNYLFIDTSGRYNLFIEITRIVNLYLKYNKAIERRLEIIKSKVEGKLNGSFLLYALTHQMSQKEWRKIYKETTLDKIAEIIIEKNSEVQLNNDIVITEGFKLYKMDEEKSSLSIIAFGKSQMATDNQSYMVNLFKKMVQKFRNVKNDNSKNLLIILKYKGITKWWQVGQFIADMIVFQEDKIFAKDVIDGVYEIIFDEQWTSDITLDMCYPQKGSRGLCPKQQLFDNETVYRVFRDIYFPQ